MDVKLMMMMMMIKLPAISMFTSEQGDDVRGQFVEGSRLRESCFCFDCFWSTNEDPVNE